MTAEPEDLLRGLPQESPPSEIVLAAVRVFRYRAIGAIAIAVALVLSVVILKDHLDAASRLRQRIATASYEGGGVSSPSSLRKVGGVNIMLWEVVTDEESVFLHVLAWDLQRRDFNIEIVNPSIDGRSVQLADVDGFSGQAGLTTADYWQEIRVPTSTSTNELTFQVRVTGDVVGITTFSHDL